MSVFFRKAGLLLIFLLGLKDQIIWAQNRIIGGQSAKIEDFPYMLRLFMGGADKKSLFGCGASILSNEWALSAAHCFDESQIDLNNITIVAGSASMINLERTASKHKVIMVTPHESYHGINASGPITGDMAVLKISPPLKFNKAIQPIKLPEKGQNLKTNPGIASGWGKTSVNGKSSDVLKSARVPLVNKARCARRYLLLNHTVKKDEICHGYRGLFITRDKCFGDSGGPVVNTDRIQIGVVSYGVQCGLLGVPGVESDVLFHRDWIKEKTGL